MTRIRFNISAALNKWRHRGRVSPVRFRMMDLASLDDMPRGPGWFDSSWDLGQGLAVEVALPGDPPYQAWIEAQARALVPVMLAPAQQISTEGMLEFEPLDWKAWVAPHVVVDPLPEPHPPSRQLPELSLVFEPAELELALV
jgi:hypothetical protein